MNNSNMPDTSLLSVQQSISTSFPVVEISRMDAPWWWDVVKCYKLLNAKKITQLYYDPICSPLCLKCQNSCGAVNISILCGHDLKSSPCIAKMIGFFVMVYVFMFVLVLWFQLDLFVSVKKWNNTSASESGKQQNESPLPIFTAVLIQRCNATKKHSQVRVLLGWLWQYMVFKNILFWIETRVYQ